MPQTLTHLGTRWYRTGKTGNLFTTGEPCAEYEADDGRRLWATTSAVYDVG